MTGPAPRFALRPGVTPPSWRQGILLAYMPRGFHLLIAAQFFSALADNALLIVTIALLAEQSLPGWWAPMLKFGFTVSYVVFAPFVGPLADAVPKARLMAWMNGVKVVGAMLLLLGAHPVAGFALVGLGAAAYAPAKYGLITETVPPRQLVAANGWVEVTVVGAALLGTVAGGFLVGAWVVQSLAAEGLASWLAAWTGEAHASAYTLSLCLVLGVYALAAGLNLRIPDSGARYARGRRDAAGMVQEFTGANRTLWRDPLGGLSLAATTLLWGVGATLQFTVLKWAQDALHLTLERAAYLQAAVAVGMVAGACAAARWVPLPRARRLLVAGIALGLCLPVVAMVQSLPLAVVMLAGVGALGGIVVVPLNALLQHRGCQVLTAGRSIAVQGFNENVSVLAMLALYSGLLALEVRIEALLWAFGAFIALAMAALSWHERRLRSLDPPE